MTQTIKRALMAGLMMSCFLTGASAFALPDSNCLIKIEKTSRRGERERVKFGTRLRSRQECQTLAKMHQPNFEPELVSRKKVGFKWKG